MAAMAGGAWYKSGKFTAPDDTSNPYIIEFGKTLTKYLFIVEMTEDSKSSLCETGLTAQRIYSWVGIYPLRTIANSESGNNLLANRITPSTSALSAAVAAVFTCSGTSISIPVKSISNTTNSLYPGYEYTYFVVEIK